MEPKYKKIFNTEKEISDIRKKTVNSQESMKSVLTEKRKFTVGSINENGFKPGLKVRAGATNDQSGETMEEDEMSGIARSESETG